MVIGIFALTIFAIGLSQTFIQSSEIFWPLVGLSSALLLANVAHSSNLGWGSFGSVFFLTTLVFHLGLFPYFWLGLRDSYGFADYYFQWLNQTNARSASAFVIVALSVGAIGYSAFPILKSIHNNSKQKSWISLPRFSRSRKVRAMISGLNWRLLGTYGAFLSILGAHLIFTNYSLFSGYNDFLTKSNVAMGAWGPFLILGGLGLSIASQTKLSILFSGTLALGALGAMAYSGSRIFISIAVLISLVTWVKRRGLRLQGVWIGLAVFLLIVVSSLRGLRDGNLSIFTVLNPLNGLYELGGSFRPLFEIMRLESVGFVSHADTYDNVLVIWILSKVSEIRGAGNTSNLYGYGVEKLGEYFGEEYRFAYSNLAELFMNFTLPVGLIVALLAGILLATLDNYRAGTSIGGAITLVFAVPLLFAVRQPGSLIVPHLIMMTALVAIGIAFVIIASTTSQLLHIPRFEKKIMKET
jgi:hypothetical protein